MRDTALGIRWIGQPRPAFLPSEDSTCTAGLRNKSHVKKP